MPGCEEAELITTAPVMGVRDSRRIVGEFELGIEDFRNRRQFSRAHARMLIVGAVMRNLLELACAILNQASPSVPPFMALLDTALR